MRLSFEKKSEFEMDFFSTTRWAPLLFLKRQCKKETKKILEEDEMHIRLFI